VKANRLEGETTYRRNDRIPFSRVFKGFQGLLVINTWSLSARELQTFCHIWSHNIEKGRKSSGTGVELMRQVSEKLLRNLGMSELGVCLNISRETSSLDGDRLNRPTVIWLTTLTLPRISCHRIVQLFQTVLTTL